MKPSDLVTLWAAPDHTRLTAKQYTIRLPIPVAAQISALCDLYPNKNRTELIGDLLASALDVVKDTLPYSQSDEVIGLDEKDEPVYRIYGPQQKFYELTRKYTNELEAELAQGGQSQEEHGSPVKPAPRMGKRARTTKK